MWLVDAVEPFSTFGWGRDGGKGGDGKWEGSWVICGLRKPWLNWVYFVRTISQLKKPTFLKALLSGAVTSYIV